MVRLVVFLYLTSCIGQIDQLKRDAANLATSIFQLHDSHSSIGADGKEQPRAPKPRDLRKFPTHTEALAEAGSGWRDRHEV